MVYRSKLSKRLALLRSTRAATLVPVLALAACSRSGDARGPLLRDPLSPEPAATVQRLVLTPDSVNVPADSSVTFRVVGITTTGDSTAPAVVWNATGGAVRDSSANGRRFGIFTPDSTLAPGTVMSIEARNGSARVSARAIMQPGRRSIARLVVRPALALVAVGGSATFSVTGITRGGDSIPLTAIGWRATGGGSLNNGTFNAGLAPGSFWAVASFGGVTDSANVVIEPPVAAATTPDIFALPLAQGQGPQFDRYVGATMPAGSSYRDPVTDVRVWKVTSASVPTANSAMFHDYASSVTLISRSWGAERHTLIVTAPNGMKHLVDFTRAVGFSNWRPAPVSGILRFTFSQRPATPRIAYYVDDQFRIQRFNTETNRIENIGNFPGNLSGVGAATLNWLQQDANDEWFVAQDEARDLVVAWNSRTNVVRTRRVPQLDEPHIMRDGRYVALLAGTAPTGLPGAGQQGVVIWDLDNDTVSPMLFGQSHLEGLRGKFVAVDPSQIANHEFAWDLRSNARIDLYTGTQLAAGGSHRSGVWFQPDDQLAGDLRRQWYLLGTFLEGGVGLAPAFTQVQGDVWAVPITGWWYNKRVTGVRIVRQTTGTGSNRPVRELRSAPSVAAMTEGSFFFDAAADRLYVWAVGGGNPTNRVEARAPGAVHDAISFVRADGTAMRIIAHHYSIYRNNYWAQPRANVSADGKLAMWSSNMGDPDGRTDVFLAEIPVR